MYAGALVMLIGTPLALGSWWGLLPALVLGRGAELCDAELLENRLAACGCVAGFSKLPNDAGIGSRVLAADGGTLARALEAGFAIAFEALIRAPPARRRK